MCAPAPTVVAEGHKASPYSPRPIAGSMCGVSNNQILDRNQLDLALGAERYLLFKHSSRCPISFHAQREYEAFVEAHPNVPTGWIDVVKQRDWSRWAAEVLGVTHESPQAIWIRDGHAAWHASHGGITAKELDRVTD